MTKEKQNIFQKITEDLQDIEVLTEQDFDNTYGEVFDKEQYDKMPLKLIVISEDDEGEIYTAMDNSDHCCWTEDFNTVYEALAYLLDPEFEVRL